MFFRFEIFREQTSRILVESMDTSNCTHVQWCRKHDWSVDRHIDRKRERQTDRQIESFFCMDTFFYPRGSSVRVSTKMKIHEHLSLLCCEFCVAQAPSVDVVCQIFARVRRPPANGFKHFGVRAHMKGELWTLPLSGRVANAQQRWVRTGDSFCTTLSACVECPSYSTWPTNAGLMWCSAWVHA